MNSARSKSENPFNHERVNERNQTTTKRPVTELRGDNIRKRVRVLSVLAATFIATIAAVDHSVMNAQTGSTTGLVTAPVSAEPLVMLSLVTRGKPGGSTVDSPDYPVDVRCSSASGVRLKTTGGADSLSVPLKSGATRQVSATDFPSLTAADTCVAASTGAGTDVFYRTTATPTNGVATEPASGMISGGRYQSATAQANGRTIENPPRLHRSFSFDQHGKRTYKWN
jgi:hypothetical protein